MVAKTVGEVDTRPPFQSVRDAVTLFGERAFSIPGLKFSLSPEKRVFSKETQIHMPLKEFNILKERLKNAETSQARALADLHQARTTVGHLTLRLQAVSQLKQEEEAMVQTMQLQNCATSSKDESFKHHATEEYSNTMSQLDAAKQELTKIRLDCDSSLQAKVDALEQAAQVENAAKTNMERAAQISNHISGVHISIEHQKLGSAQAHQDQAKIYEEKDVHRQTHKTKIEDSAKKLFLLDHEFDPHLTTNLDTLLTNTVTQIATLQKEMDNAKASDLDSVRTVTSELDSAKDSLHKVAEEEFSLRNLLHSLKLELENVKLQHLTLKENESETETIAGNLNIRLRKSKVELETCLAENFVTRGDSDEMISTLDSLSLETEDARKESKEMKIKAEEMKKGAEDTRKALQEAENTLRVALEEGEEAKAAELKALDQIKALSERTTAARAPISDLSSADIPITKEEFESLKGKVKESEILAEMKVGAALAEVEAVKASEKEAVKQLEASQKEIKGMKIATQEAIRRAEMSEAAKKAVEGELRRWYERDRKKAAEAAARILAESAMMSSKESSSQPLHYIIHKQNLQPPQNTMEAPPKKYQKAKTLATPKKKLMPSMSGMFSRKKKQIEGGSPKPV